MEMALVQDGKSMEIAQWFVPALFIVAFCALIGLVAWTVRSDAVRSSGAAVVGKARLPPVNGR